jgi:hypothetical protein
VENTKNITIENLKLKILVYGPSGVGKTTFACSFREVGTVYVADFDGGLLGQRKSDVDYDRFTNYADFAVKLKELEAKPSHDTIVLDSVTTMQEYMMDYLLELSHKKMMTMDQWNILISDLKDLIMRLTNIAKNVVVVAHQQLVQDEITSEVFVLPLIVGKKMPALLPLWFDEVYHFGVTKDAQGKPIYYFDTVAQDKYLGKSRLDVLPSRVEWEKTGTRSAYNVIKGYIEKGGGNVL